MKNGSSSGGMGGVGRRWSSLSGTGAGLEETAVKVATRRHSEGQRARHRRGRRRQQVEVEEEFFDDEFNASLFQQPHMQLSVGSSENLLDSRAPHSMLADGAASPASSLVFSSFSPSLTTSEDEVDEAELKGGTARAAVRARWGRLGALKEDGSSEAEDDEDEPFTPRGKDGADTGISPRKVHQGKEDLNADGRITINPRKDQEAGTGINARQQKATIADMERSEKQYIADLQELKEHKWNHTVNTDEDKNRKMKEEVDSDCDYKLRLPSESDGGNSEDSEYGPFRYKEFGKDYEPLKSVQLLRNLEKSLNTYLPAHSIGSDTESGEL